MLCQGSLIWKRTSPTRSSLMSRREQKISFDRACRNEKLAAAPGWNSGAANRCRCPRSEAASGEESGRAGSASEDFYSDDGCSERDLLGTASRAARERPPLQGPSSFLDSDCCHEPNRYLRPARTVLLYASLRSLLPTKLNRKNLLCWVEGIQVTSIFIDNFI